jgi:hypothetical protein
MSFEYQQLKADLDDLISKLPVKYQQKPPLSLQRLTTFFNYLVDEKPTFSGAGSYWQDEKKREQALAKRRATRLKTTTLELVVIARTSGAELIFHDYAEAAEVVGCRPATLRTRVSLGQGEANFMNHDEIYRVIRRTRDRSTT